MVNENEDVVVVDENAAVINWYALIVNEDDAMVKYAYC